VDAVRPILVRALVLVVDGAWLTLDRSATGPEADDAIACDAQIVARGGPGIYEITSYRSLGDHDEGPLHDVRRIGDLPRLGAP